MAHFQVMLAGEWKNFSQKEDGILKRSFMAGYPNCRFKLRGAPYEYSFDRMIQKNLTTGKERKIRAPYRWQQPARPIVPKGPTLCMTVPADSPGKTIQIDHPKVKGAHIEVAVPRYAKVGQPMLVPIPDVAVASNVSVVTAGVLSVDTDMSNVHCNAQGQVTPVAVPVKAAPAAANKVADNKVCAPAKGNAANAKKSGWSIRAKVAAGGAAVAALGGGAFAAAYAATEAREGGEVPSTEAEDHLYVRPSWDWSEGPAGGDAVLCPASPDAVAELPEVVGGAGEAAGEDAAGEDEGFTMCGDDGGLPDDAGIIDADDDAEWLADMCGFEDDVSGDGADAAADFVVDLF